MLPLERQKRIRALIQEKQSIKIAALSELLEVSEMTIHRDIKPLIDEGMVVKTFGGITRRNTSSNKTLDPGLCVYCSQPTNERFGYRLILPDNQMETACCAHCGLLRHRQIGDKVIQAIVPDFLRQTMISAPASWYVMDTSISISCCQPQVLTFEQKGHADGFVHGFGGNVYSFTEAMERVFQKMTGNHTGCTHHVQEGGLLE